MRSLGAMSVRFVFLMPVLTLRMQLVTNTHHIRTHTGTFTLTNITPTPTPTPTHRPTCVPIWKLEAMIKGESTVCACHAANTTRLLESLVHLCVCIVCVCVCVCLGRWGTDVLHSVMPRDVYNARTASSLPKDASKSGV